MADGSPEVGAKAPDALSSDDQGSMYGIGGLPPTPRSCASAIGTVPAATPAPMAARKKAEVILFSM
ncbi:MAG: hypothetical protein QNJ87_04220 [Gammaproteobacteria bacterium]|nr:hypothetical protein [Gammaproteobacteria bacterium]MDJ0893245.1 hypothetical protein [Gammaproteobacteria bacterium]